MRTFLTLILLLALGSLPGLAEPVKVCPANPHYLMFKGKPVVLITSDHHYGAVMDRDFDFSSYLNYLGRHWMNLTRIYPGGMFEPPDKWLRGNPLGPRPGRQILPWPRSTQAGAHPSLGEPGQPAFKFDLDRWDAEYFTRLRAFVEQARKLDIVVEVAFFNGMYKDCWPLMPLYHGNNIQGVGNYEADAFLLFTTAGARNADVLERQKAYIRKITAELNRYDNVIYDICDEPTINGGKDSEVIPWILAMKDAFVEAERALPNKHVLGQTVQSSSPDLSGDAWCDWLPTEYVAAARAALEKNYGANKPIVDVESDYYGYGLVKPYTVDDVRVEGWWFMLGGGAGFIHLNGEYYRGQETGGPDTQTRIVPEKMILRDFMESLDLVGLRRFTGLGGIPAGAIASAIAEPGRQYAVYLFHGKNDGQWGAHFVVTPGKFEDTLTLTSVPSGDYGLEWIDPATGKVKRTEAKTHSGGTFQVATPPYTMDVALRMRRSEMFGSEAPEAGGAAEKPQTYATTFNLAEDPISEGGKWINNRTVGPHWWHDVMITNGTATGSAKVKYYWWEDPTALLAGTWGPDQAATATVYCPNTVHGNSEVELRLRSSLSANSNTGYECCFAANKTGSNYMDIVRWNGSASNYTYLARGSSGVAHGDTVKGTIIGNVITIYVNGVQKLQTTDDTYKSGSPGIGFDMTSEAGFTDFTVTCTGGEPEKPAKEKP